MFELERVAVLARLVVGWVVVDAHLEPQGVGVSGPGSGIEELESGVYFPESWPESPKNWLYGTGKPIGCMAQENQNPGNQNPQESGLEFHDPW